ncbi:hypothetical protein CASFOL_025213 [Castilleja foliolosa]|uniref:F-box domain-containing protein n=1 Tax=Castilleja foliolosa TaxID=1961234 RepID=A0ABD3CSQ9_9LAMI
MAGTSVDELPEECLSNIISFTSPQDACRSAIVSAAFCDASNEDDVWESFLPSDYREILSRLVFPVEFSSKKDLFRRLSSTPLLIDGGKMTFLIDKRTNKKCYMLSARELSIAWSRNSLYWSWKSVSGSRFTQVVELRMVCWLEIYGKINIENLSPHTTYGVYLVIQLTERAFGLDVVPSEALIQTECCKSRGTICLSCDERKKRGIDTLKEGEKGDRVVCVREDEWLEVELGEFYNSGNLKELKMWFREIKGVHLKGGLLVEGIELRPKD